MFQQSCTSRLGTDVFHYNGIVSQGAGPAGSPGRVISQMADKMATSGHIGRKARFNCSLLLIVADYIEAHCGANNQLFTSV